MPRENGSFRALQPGKFYPAVEMVIYTLDAPEGWFIAYPDMEAAIHENGVLSVRFEKQEVSFCGTYLVRWA
jgi:hypothetical protein